MFCVPYIKYIYAWLTAKSFSDTMMINIFLSFKTLELYRGIALEY